MGGRVYNIYVTTRHANMKTKHLQTVYYPLSDRVICNVDGEITDRSTRETLDMVESDVGLINAIKIMRYVTEFSAVCRHFEISDEQITVEGLWRHATTGKIHKSNYDIIIWKKPTQ